MTFYEILSELMKTNKITAKQLSETLKIGKNQFKYWKDKGNIPSGDTLISLADYFNVSIDYLLGRTDKPTLTGGTYINGDNNNNGNQAINGNININATGQDDLQLLEMIKKLDLIQRSKIIAKIDEMQNENKAKK